MFRKLTDTLNPFAAAARGAKPPQGDAEAFTTLDAVKKPFPKDGILKDVYQQDGAVTYIEVSADSISLRDGSGAPPRVVPLTADAEFYDAVDENIRCQIARKIAALVPNLDEGIYERLQEYTVRVLHVLARDQLPRVRKIIAEELKSTPNAPREVVQKLAWDEDIEVAIPILQYSPLLGDDELIDILRTSNLAPVCEAIARRSKISAPVGETIAGSGHLNALVALAENPGAELSAASVECLLEHVPRKPELLNALIEHPEVTLATLNRIAGFLSSAVINTLKENGEFSAETAQNVTLAVQTRIRNLHIERERAADIRAQELYAYGALDQERIMTALDAGEPEFVIAAVTLRTGFSKDKVQRILNSQNARAVTALTWKAGLTMRCSIQFQLRLSKIHHTRLLNAKGGFDFPLSESQMQEYLDHFEG